MGKHMMRAVAYQHLRRRHQINSCLVLCFVGIMLFLAYTIVVVTSGILTAVKEYRALSPQNRDLPRIQLLEYEQDEVVKVLGGPDENSLAQESVKTMVMGHRDMTSVERSLTRLLRMRRLMSVENMDVSPADPRMCQIKPKNQSLDTGDETLFPTDLFTMEQRMKGAIVFHFIGLVYMFIALAIVCDEYFVPSLGVITEVLDISDDVAGATFMAAGGSAPEFFTSLFGVFITQNNVGIGTIVGSATFNILCVLAFCTLFSKQVLVLTWWPMFRDIFFYVVGLLFLLLFFMDEQIVWYEALMLLCIYLLYGLFMKYNTQIEYWAKGKLFRVDVAKIITVEHETTTDTGSSARRRSAATEEALSEHRKSIPVLHSGAMFRAGIAHMALDETPPEEVSSLPTTSRSQYHEDLSAPRRQPRVINDGSRTVMVSGTPKRLPKMASFPAYQGPGGTLNGIRKSHTSDHKNVHSDTNSCIVPASNGSNASGRGNANNVQNGVSPVLLERSISALLEEREKAEKLQARNLTDVVLTPVKEMSEVSSSSSPTDAAPKLNGTSKMYDALTEHAVPEEEKEIEQPIDMSWPKSFKNQFLYVALAPIMWPLFLTLPDVKKTCRRKLFILAFVGSILWIAFYSYLMVWWANTIGVTLGVPTEIMGLTILAAGTSIPDLITSVIVSRKGLGDMAVSSSIGSNLFDICVGLPIPWLLFFAVQASSGLHNVHISVTSNGLICSVGLLFSMLLTLVVAIAVSRWRMNKVFGIIMVASYVTFCVISVFLELGFIQCPLRIMGSSC